MTSTASDPDGAATPVPDRPMVGLPPLVTSASVALFAPSCAGAKTKVTVQLCEAVSDIPFAQVPVRENAAALGPPAVSDDTTSVPPPPLVMLNVCAALVVPNATLPNASGPGAVSSRGGTGAESANWKMSPLA